MKRIKIRGATWKIARERPPSNFCTGLCDYDSRTIYIRPNCPDPIGTVIHELLHANFPDIEEEAIEEAEESIVKALEIIGA